MALTLKQVSDVCLNESGSDQCRYLAEDEASPGNFYCLKMVPVLSREIDDEVDDFCQKVRSRGVDPATSGVPLGDNCAGYRFLWAKMQGYDVP